MSSPGRRFCNALTVDLEDWHALVLRRLTGRDWSSSEALRAQVDELLNLFAVTGTRATFFVVGKVAEEQPGLVRRIVGAEHEIGSHGYAHRRVDELGPQGLADDLQRSVEVLGGLTGERPAAFRAPEFSIGRTSLWALGTLPSPTRDTGFLAFPGPSAGYVPQPISSQGFVGIDRVG